MAYNQLGQWAGPHAGYYNEVGEPIMTGEQARFEAALDEQAAYERQFDEDYWQDREDSFMEDLYDQQEQGQCPACAEDGCDKEISYDFDRRMAYHEAEA